MTKQEKIMKGIEFIYCRECRQDDCVRLSKGKTEGCLSSKGFVYRLLIYLHENGAGIKVEGKLPPLLSRDIYSSKEMDIAIKQAGLMFRVGYTRWEPLIEVIE